MKTQVTRKAIKWVLGVLLLVLAAGQFFNPARTNPAVEPKWDLLASNAPPAEIVALLRQSCYNCHSYETKWPWYSRMWPASAFLVSHVNEGREVMNFSEWPQDDPDEARRTWKRIGHQVETGRMPLSSYTWIHLSARLTGAQRKELADWATKTANSKE